MIYHLFDFLQRNYNTPGAELFQFISFRAAAAIITSLLISIVFGGRIIRSLKRLQVGETVRDLGLKGQLEKEGTPTMGGFIIILATLIPCLLFADLSNVYIQLLIFTTIWMAAIGFADDYIKVFRKNKQGLHGKFKVFGQIVLGIVVGLVMLLHSDVVVRLPYADAVEGDFEVIKTFDTQITQVGRAPFTEKVAYVKATITNLPFIKDNEFDYGLITSFLGDYADEGLFILFLLIVVFIVTAVSNAANLTDGIDGLAAGTSAIIGATLGILAYVSGNTVIADYLNIIYLPFTGELAIFSACFVGGCVGFLWYNSYPARVFMGDTGSLMIGGVIAVIAFLIRKELLIPILCGIFVVENLSVVLQVSYFKYTKKKYGEGRRIFKMSPLHHHFQKLGMHESKIVTRFWIVGIILAILTIVTLKVR